MPTRPRAAPGDRRQALLDAVTLVLLEEGPSKVGPNATARRAGVNKQLTYHYFGTFEKLLRAWAEAQEIWPVGSELFGADPSGFRALDPKRRWSLVVRRFVRTFRARPSAAAIIGWCTLERTPFSDLVEQRRSAGMALITDQFPDLSTSTLRPLLAILFAAVEQLLLAELGERTFGTTDPGDDLHWDEVVSTLEDLGQTTLTR